MSEALDTSPCSSGKRLEKNRNTTKTEAYQKAQRREGTKMSVILEQKASTKINKRRIEK